VFPGDQHVFFLHKVARDANLDVDDVDGYGPETITVSKKHWGERYVYAVHSFTNGQQPESSALSLSGAKVFVYIGESLVRTYYVPRGQGNLWVVFAVDGAGEIHDLNRMTGVRGQSMPVAALDEYLADDAAPATAQAPSAAPSAAPAAAPSAAPSAAPAVAAQQADEVNKQGEVAYHAGRLDESIDLYLKAIELDPGFSQAYSNLGLSYRKAGRTAEAIWANRRSIALARGDNAGAVRASSYYNIARIYEDAGQYEDALVQYRLADRDRPAKVYKDAVARMKAKLK
jgi:hypothetical protein